MGLEPTTAGDQSNALAAQQKAQQDSSINQINSAFSGFDSSYYNKIAQDYSNYATPELSRQYTANQQASTGALADSGLWKSSVADTNNQNLNLGFAQGQQQIADAGTQQAQSFQSNVENQKSSLINQALASSDPLTIANNALGVASSVQAPSVFAPVGTFFNQGLNLYSNDQAAKSTANLNNVLNSALAAGAFDNAAAGQPIKGGVYNVL
jgi:hypothetical protein